MQWVALFVVLAVAGLGVLAFAAAKVLGALRELDGRMQALTDELAPRQAALQRELQRLQRRGT